MSDPKEYRLERIQRLLRELQYEVTRGILENEIDEEIKFQFFIGLSRKIPDGSVYCSFTARPVTGVDALWISGDPKPPTLRVVK